MKKLNVAVIGQGRSGKDIHCFFFHSDKNTYFEVTYVVDFDEVRLKKALEWFPNSKTFTNYKDLFIEKNNIDLVVVSTFSETHYEVAHDLLKHGFNVLVEKPMASSTEQCHNLIKTARENNAKLAVFQQSQYAPFYLHAKKVIESGILGKIHQIKLRWNGFARRWDWQTLQKHNAGNLLNTGPHPIGMALGFIDYDKTARVVYSRLATTINSSGDSDDFTKVLIEAENSPLLDIETHSISAFNGYNVLILGEKGNYKTNTTSYELKYYLEEENPKKSVVDGPLMDENHSPLYCQETMKFHEEKGKYDGTAFDSGTASLYEDLYFYLTKNRKMQVVPEMGEFVISICEEVHRNNPLKKKYF